MIAGLPDKKKVTNIQAYLTILKEKDNLRYLRRVL